MYLARVYVTLKATVNDPQGKAVMVGLKTLGFGAVESVRIGKYLEIRVLEVGRDEANRVVEDMCLKLLANPVIEEFNFELEDLDGSDH
jgi:phosphoribosylformylglycinamidine synthase PurS subunit